MIVLPGTGRRTSQLGFGCSYLTPENAAVLDAAFDAGIRHFDVARAYGRGLTEVIVGKFLRRHAAEVTVTSKYGITPPFSHPLHAWARRALQPVVRRLRRRPVLDQRLNAVGALQTRKASFRGRDARDSLQLSLRNLGVTRIDLFLMHEPVGSDLRDPELVGVLRAAVADGRIGAFGIGGPERHLDELLIQHPEFGGVLQYEWTAIEAKRSYAESFTVLYRVIGAAVKRLEAALAQDKALRRRWSDEVGHDLAPGAAAGLMLHAAAALQPQAMILFSSTRPQRIFDNVRVATDADLTGAALRLVDLAKRWIATQSPLE
jgi:diketogulonate reductase-like aldo/keto reductase